MGGCTMMPAFEHGIIAARGGWGGGWRDVKELNDKEHWLRFYKIFTLGAGVDASNICST
jgi:hypothetical protein